jgi:hypothetical protein
MAKNTFDVGTLHVLLITTKFHSDVIFVILDFKFQAQFPYITFMTSLRINLYVGLRLPSSNVPLLKAVKVKAKQH